MNLTPWLEDKATWLTPSHLLLYVGYNFICAKNHKILIL